MENIFVFLQQLHVLASVNQHLVSATLGFYQDFT